MELMVGGDLLGEAGAVRLEDDEVPDQAEEAFLLKDPLYQNFKSRHGSRCDDITFNRPPRHEPSPVSRKRAEAGLDPVRDGQHLVEDEQPWNLVFVGLKLL